MDRYPEEMRDDLDILKEMYNQGVHIEAGKDLTEENYFVKLEGYELEVQSVSITYSDEGRKITVLPEPGKDFTEAENFAQEILKDLRSQR